MVGDPTSVHVSQGSADGRDLGAARPDAEQMPNWLILALTVRAASAVGWSEGYCGVTQVTGQQGCNRHGQRGAWLLSAAE